MSVKFEETIKQTTTEGASKVAEEGSKHHHHHLPGHDLAHDVGEALTRGGGGPRGYLAVS
jgi:hypothetical protein